LVFSENETFFFISDFSFSPSSFLTILFNNFSPKDFYDFIYCIEEVLGNGSGVSNYNIFDGFIILLIYLDINKLAVLLI